jgi:hypothetical protein
MRLAQHRALATHMRDIAGIVVGDGGVGEEVSFENRHDISPATAAASVGAANLKRVIGFGGSHARA